MAELKPEALTAPVNGTPANANGTESSPVTAYPLYTPPPHLPRPPFVDVEGIGNFRNLGGYICSPYGKPDTHVVRPSLIYRCAHPTQVSPSGSTFMIKELNIGGIYDLRSAPEVTRTNAASAQPEALPDADLLSLRHFTPVYATEDYSPDALARKLGWYSAAPNADPQTSTLPPFSQGFLNAYRDISIHGIPAYRKILSHLLTDPTSPLVFHCTAGKDRTGVLAAVILRLCGVDDQTICWEYALTEPGLGLWRDVFMQRMKKHGLGSGAFNGGTEGRDLLTDEEAGRICGSRGANMGAYLKIVLDGEFGGAERYLVEKVGFTVEEVHRLKASLLVPIEEFEGEVVRVVGIPGWSVDGGVTEEFVRVGKKEGGELGLDTGAGREVEEKVMVG